MVGLIEKDPGSINAFNMLKSFTVAKLIKIDREEYQTKIDLAETKSMWSLIELGPFVKDIDEKQENMDILVKCLLNKGYDEITIRLS